MNQLDESAKTSVRTEIVRYTCDRFRYNRRDAKRVLAVPPRPVGGRSNAASPYLIASSVARRRFRYESRATGGRDHSRDIVDTEPKMTKALLIARGGFIADENRILRPADRPGRPPFLRPIGADQSRDDGDVAHPAHRHLARLHDVAVLSICHMASIEQVCQRRAGHAMTGRAG